MRSGSLLAMGVAAWVLLPAAAAQAQATAEGADKIRLGLKDWIAIHLSAPDKSVVVTFQGAITVEPQGNSYKAVIPKADVVFDADSDPSHLSIDPIQLQMTPTGNGWLDTVATIPTTYRFASARDDDKGVELTIG